MLLSGRAPTDAPNRERCVLSERESSYSFMCLVSLFATLRRGGWRGKAKAREEDEVWDVRGRYTCNTTPFDTPYSITVVEAAKIEGS